jgi:hypothetical protein
LNCGISTFLGLLNKGLNYVHLPSTPPIDDIIVGIESALQLVPYEELIYMGSRCQTIFGHGRSNMKLTSPVAPDLKKQGCLALKADKWNAVLLLKEEAYDDNMKSMLQEGPYKVVSKTPLHRMVRQVKDTLAHIKNKNGVNP